MLLDIRDKIRGWIAYVIVGLISIPFVLWGVGEYFSGGREEPVAVVNDMDITARQFEQAYAAQRQQVIQALGGSASADMLESLNIRRQVLDRMIDETVLAQYTQKAGYRAPDAVLVGVIESIDAFREDGQFSRDRYERMLRMQGMSVAGFEAQLRRDIATEQLNTAVLNSAIGIDRMVDQFVALRDQQREVGVLRLSRDAWVDRLEPVSEAEIEAHFEANRDRYFQPERVMVEYIALTPEAVAGDVVIDEARLAMAYEDHVRRVGEETRHWASHILVTVPADADAETVEAAREAILNARERIEGGESFADVAREVSEDPGSRGMGGELGEVEAGVMVKPFEDALFALDEEGALSEPVRTQFGYHLIRLDRKVEGEVPELDDVRDELIVDLRRREAEGQFHDLVEAMANIAYENPDSLLPVAETLGVEIETSDWFDRGQGEGIARFSQLREIAFSEEVLVERHNSDPIDLGDSKVVVLRVKQREDRQPLALEQVRDEIVAELREMQVEETLREEAERLREALLADDDVDALIEDGLTRWTDGGWIDRQSDALPASVVRRAFAMGRPGEDESLAEVVALPDGDYGVVVIHGVRDGDPATLSEQERRQLRVQMAQDTGLREIDALAAQLRDAADIELRRDMR